MRIAADEADAHHLHLQHAQRREDREHRDHHRGRAGDHAGRLTMPRSTASRVGRPRCDVLTDPAQHEDVVVHRQPDQHDQHEQRDPVDHEAGAGEVEQPCSPAVLEDQRQQPEGDADRRQVQHRRDQRDRHAAEREAHHQQRQQQHEADHQRQRGRAPGRRSRDSAAPPPTATRVSVEDAEGGGDQVVAESSEGVVHLRVGLVERHGQLEHRGTSVLGDLHGLAPEATKSSVPVGLASRAASAAATAALSRQAPRRPPGAVAPSAGNSSVSRVNVCTSGMSSGRVSRLAWWIFMPRAGTASSATTTPETSSATTGTAEHGAEQRGG